MKLYIPGVNAVIERLKNRNAKVVRVFIDPSKYGRRIDEILELAERREIEVQRTRPPTPAGVKDQGVAVEIPPPPQVSLEKVLKNRKSPSTILLLDGITDPHNLGACIRVAACVGAEAVVIPKHSASPVTPAAAKAASGGLEIVPVITVTNLNQTISILKDAGYWIAGAGAEGAHDYDQLDHTRDLAIIIGGEAKGMRRLVRESCDWVIKIPMAEGMESLNASVASAVILFDIDRRRKQ